MGSFAFHDIGRAHVYTCDEPAAAKHPKCSHGRLAWAVHQELGGRPAPAVVPDPLALFSGASAGLTGPSSQHVHGLHREQAHVPELIRPLPPSQLLASHWPKQGTWPSPESVWNETFPAPRTIRKRGPSGAPDVTGCRSGKELKTETVNFEGWKNQGGLPEEEGLDQRGAGALFSSLLLSCGPRRITNRSVKI